MNRLAFACWTCLVAVGSVAGSAPASAKERVDEGSIVVDVLDLAEPGGSAYGGGPGPIGNVPPGMSSYYGYPGGETSGYPGAYSEAGPFGYDAAPLPDVVAAKREQLIASLRQLQDAYCRAAMLDEAVAVREQVQLLEVLRSTPLPPIADAAPSPERQTPAPSGIDDGRPYSHRGRNGESFYTEVTGRTSGSVWGDGVYTDDSDLATAAVHAGVLEEGETKVVKFTILPGQDSYVASTANGVATRSWSSYSGSFRIDAAAMRLLYPYALRGQGLERLQVFVVGSANAGTAWGTDIYTDDSALDVAAVHAGVVAEGEKGIVTIELLAGRDAYEGSDRNGVASSSYSSWDASYRFLPRDEGADQEEETSNLRETRTVTGSTAGYVWGSGVYTSDSDLGTAAVHAGLLQDGETGAVTIERLPGRDAYQGSASNGVESRDYGSWSASYRFVDDPSVTTRRQQRRDSEIK